MTDPSQVDAAVWLPLIRQALASEGRFRFPLAGDSMRPTLPVRCEIEIAPLVSPPALGDLIVFVVDDALVAHRLVRRKADALIAQGDNRRGPDRPLLPDQVIGRVTSAYVNGSRIWPGPPERLAARFWIARHHACRGARWIARKLR